MLLRRRWISTGIPVAAFWLAPLAADAVAQPAPRNYDARHSEETATAEPGYLGVIGDDRAESGRGVRIRKVDRDSPADAGMLKEGDLIYKINDQPIRNGRDMHRVMSRIPAGANVKFFVDRQGSQKERDVTLGERPARESREREFGVIGESLPPPPGEFAEPQYEQAPNDNPPPVPGASQDDIAIPPPPTPDRASLGVRSVPPTELDKAQHGLPNLRGAVVLSIAAGSPAHLARIPLQSVIVAIDGQNVSGPTDLARRIATYEPGQEIEVSYYFKREHHRQRLALADAAEVDAGPQLTANGGQVESSDAGSANDSSDRVEALERDVETLKRRIESLERTIKSLQPATNR
jgi:predicted metalloprotease with PDZ domain